MRINLFLCLFFAFCSCDSTTKIDAKIFDSEKWILDKRGCKGDRQKIFENFDKIKPQILTFTPQEVLALFGRPDKQSLHERGNKYYGYFIDPCCDDKKTECKMLQIKISPLDEVSGILIVYSK